jgi:hypothetical protein
MDKIRPSKFTPASVKGSKYGNKNRISDILFQGLNLSEGTKRVLAEAGEHGLASSTWSSYKTAERLLAMCQKDRNKSMCLPLGQESLLEFIGWLIEVRKLKTGSINSYLSGIRHLHILKGMDPPQLRSSMVKFLLKGKKNQDSIKSRESDEGKRLPMTMDMMRILKVKIRSWEVTIMQKLLMWAIATLAFHGAFRIHEILCKTETEFDPDFSLLTEDVKIVQSELGDVMVVTLKCPKESKAGKAVVIEVYETHGTLCPVKAFQRWKARTTTEGKLPLFRMEDGTPVTGGKMNKWLHDRLDGVVDYAKGKYTTHSFRIGLATTLGTLGFSDADVKEAGRWSSNAFELYMKLPRVRRAQVAKRIASLK